MRLQVKGKNVEVSPSMREYAERKLAKLEKQLAEPDAGRGRALRAQEPVDRGQPRRRGTIFTKGPTLRAREASPDMKVSIDQLVDKLERQVKRYRERRIVEPRRHAEHNGDVARSSRLTSAAAARQPLHRRLAEAADIAARARRRTAALAGGRAARLGRRGARRARASTASPRARRWDAVATAEAPRLRGDTRPLRLARRPHAARRGERARRRRHAARRRASTQRSPPPYRAEAVRRERRHVGGRRLPDQVVEVPGLTATRPSSP